MPEGHVFDEGIVHGLYRAWVGYPTHPFIYYRIAVIFMPGLNNNGTRPARSRSISILTTAAVALLAACAALLLLSSDGAQGRTITVDDDGGADYENIQDAINASEDGDTIRVHEGTYSETMFDSLFVNKTVNLFGSEGYATTLCSNVEIQADGVRFQGFSTTGNNRIAVYSDGNQILENNLSNKLGLAFFSSNNNTLRGNMFSGCGIIIRGDFRDNWTTHDIDTSNTVNGKPIYYRKNRDNESIPPDAGETILAGCRDILVENQDCSNGSVGILVGFSENITLRKNKCMDNYLQGICVWKSNYCIIADTTCSRSTGVVWANGQGLYMWSSDFNVIERNDFSDNKCGMFLLCSDHNTISHNNCSGSFYGLVLMSDQNLISNNTFNDNSKGGIELDSGDHNEIEKNDCIANGRYGIGVHYSDHNTLTGNNCTGNEYGMYLRIADHNAISENFLSQNRYGIYLEWNARHNKLSRNEFSDNGKDVVEEGPREPIPVIFLAILVVSTFCVIPIIGIVWCKRKRRSDGLNLAVIFFVCQIFIMGGVMLLAGAFFMARESEGILKALMIFYIIGHPGMVMLLSPIVNRSFPLDLGNPKSSALVLSLLVWFGIILFLQGLSTYDHERYHSENGSGGIFLGVLGIIAIIFGIVMIRVVSTGTLQNFWKQGQEKEKQSADIQNEE